MHKLIIYAFIGFLFSAFNANPPQASISNGLVTANLYLPDAENGYYRGTRFDWSGQISALQYKGHNYFGKWFGKYDPYLHDAIMGPVEAFDPIGYDEANAGDKFVKIGVGALIKPQEDKYFFANSYTLANGGSWKTKTRRNAVSFTHTLNDSTFSYVYTKEVKLSKDKPELILHHKLKNTGNKTIETNVMNHNFFVIDSITTGPDFVVSVPFDLRQQKTDETAAAKLSGREIHFDSGDPKGKQFFLGDLEGYSTDPKDYDITLTHQPSGTAVNIRSDKPFEKLNFWATVKTICPEPFIHLKVEPGQSFEWTITYRFIAK